ncbi:unnamed protein product [Paramecium sonneborni]|uniref:Uncharacterized protein n=1 Tax=Paramecium sonneborni TaxID=65129 RepID=A0A8S1N6J7_9CILI|nr:unnamed protein product [Paramecium sonneborni]
MQEREMSEEVRNDNPYSRLMALKRMGIVENYRQIYEQVIWDKFYVKYLHGVIWKIDTV